MLPLGRDGRLDLGGRVREMSENAMLEHMKKILYRVEIRRVGREFENGDSMVVQPDRSEIGRVLRGIVMQQLPWITVAVLHVKMISSVQKISLQHRAVLF